MSPCFSHSSRLLFKRQKRGYNTTYFITCVFNQNPYLQLDFRILKKSNLSVAYVNRRLANIWFGLVWVCFFFSRDHVTICIFSQALRSTNKSSCFCGLFLNFQIKEHFSFNIHNKTFLLLPSRKETVRKRKTEVKKKKKEWNL